MTVELVPLVYAPPREFARVVAPVVMVPLLVKVPSMLNVAIPVPIVMVPLFINIHRPPQ